MTDEMSKRLDERNPFGVKPGQIWERLRYGAWREVRVREIESNGRFARVKSERGSSIRLDRFDGKQLRLVQDVES